MFKDDVKNIFPLLKELYCLDGLILVGSDIPLWKELSDQTNIQDVHYINTLEYKANVFPENWYVYDQLLAKEDGEVSYYKMSNPLLNGTVATEVLVTLWKNLQTLEKTQKKALSLSSFMQDMRTQKNALVINSFEAKELVHQEVNIDVIIVRTIESDEEHLNHYSKTALEEQMTKQGYKLVASMEDNHPQVFTVVYVVDTEKQNEELVEQLKKEQDVKASLEQNKEELDTKVENLQKQVKELEDKVTWLRSEIANKQKTIDHLETTNDDSIESFIDDLKPFYYGKSMNYVDIGAHVGDVFLKFKKYLSIREAHLFEPNPKSFEKLTQNISSINIPKLHKYNIALSDKREEVVFSSANSMTKRVNSNLNIENEDGYFKVQSFKLSKFKKVFTDQKISLLKIDVEGSELSVLSGAKKLLEKHAIDVIYIEVGFNKNNTQQTYFVEIDNYLQSYGYRIYKIYEQVNEWIEDSPLLRRSNIAYMSETFASRNSLKLLKENYHLKQKLSEKKD